MKRIICMILGHIKGSIVKNFDITQAVPYPNTKNMYTLNISLGGAIQDSEVVCLRCGKKINQK